jgi:hypothetical protein
MLLEQITSTIANNIASGLEGMSSFDYSLQQLEDDVWSTRLALLQESALAGQAHPSSWAQRLEVTLTEINKETLPDVGPMYRRALRFSLPVPAMVFQDKSLIYIGTPNNGQAFKVYTDQGFRYHRFNRITAARPFVWLDISSRFRSADQEKVYGYIFQPEARVLSKLACECVFEHAGQLTGLTAPNEPFPAPGTVITKLINLVTERYLRYYQRGQSGLYNQPAMSQPGIPGGTTPYKRSDETI